MHCGGWNIHFTSLPIPQNYLILNHTKKGIDRPILLLVCRGGCIAELHSNFGSKKCANGKSETNTEQWMDRICSTQPNQGQGIIFGFSLLILIFSASKWKYSNFILLPKNSIHL
jgi:hypothetical protein